MRFIPQRNIPVIKAGMKTYQVIEAFLSMRGNQKDWSEIAFNLKNCGDNKLIDLTYNGSFQNYPMLENVIWGNMFPRKVEELGTGWNRYFFKPQSLDLEINWVIQGIKKYKNVLKAFTSLKVDVEKNILLGNYSTAEALLESSLKTLGYSVWYYEMRLTIAGLQDNYSKSISIVSEFNSKQKEIKRGFVPIVLSTLFSRSFRSLPAYEYDTELYSRYKKNRTEFQNDRYNYYLFRLNYYQNYNIDDLSVTLIMESLNSVVDRYVLLNYVLRSYVIKDWEKRGTASNYASSLYRITSDRCWLPYILLKPENAIPNEYFDKSFISILDDYYSGKYDDVIEECKSYLSISPSHFDVVKLYCRALLFKNNGYKPISSNSKSVIDEIARLVFSVMTEQDNSMYLDLLYQRCKNLYGLSIASGLDYYIKEEKKWDNAKWLHLSYLTCFDPLFTTTYETVEEKQAYLNWGKEKSIESIVIEYQKRRVKKLTTDDSSEVVTYIREVDNAKITFDNGDYTKSIELWGSIIEKNSEYIPTVQTAVEYTFNPTFTKKRKFLLILCRKKRKLLKNNQHIYRFREK